MHDSLYVSILRDSCAVRDVSEDEEERSKAIHAPEVSSAFESLGFCSIGLYRMGREPKQQHTHEVWRSPDSRAFLTVERDQNQKPRAELRTLLHDGTIVDTSSHFSGLARLFRRSRIHHPESAYFMELGPCVPEALWQRHVQRVEELARKRGSTVPVHDGMRMQLALCARSMAVSTVRRYHGQRLHWIVLIPATLAIVAAMLIGGATRYWLSAAAVSGVAFWYIGEVSTWASARLIYVPPASLATLLDSVDEAAQPGPEQ
jgi:hypothetical protein